MDQSENELFKDLATLDRVMEITKTEADDAFDRIRKINRHISEKLINKALEIIYSEE